MRYAALLALLLVFAAAQTASPAPTTVLTDLEGGVHRLGEWRGRWVLLKLGTTQCPNCAAQMAEIAAVEDRFQALGVVVLDVYLRETPPAVTRYWAKKNFPFRPTVLCDTEGELVRWYAVSIIPHLVLLDPDGNSVWSGRFTEAPVLRHFTARLAPVEPVPAR